MSIPRLRFRRLACAAVALSLAAGCRQTHVLIEMTPAGAGVERRVSLWSTDTDDSLSPHRPVSLGDEIDARLQRVYGTRPDTLAPYSASRRFDDIPRDVGNWGRWKVTRSPLGAEVEYAERLGGNPEPGALLTQRLAAADSIADQLRAWAATHLGPQDRCPRLRAYLAADVRADLRDLVAFSWLQGARDDSNAVANADVRWLEHPAPYDLMYYTSIDPARKLLLGDVPATNAPAAAARGALLGLLERDVSSPDERRGDASEEAAHESVDGRLRAVPKEAVPALAQADSLLWERLSDRFGEFYPDLSEPRATLEVRLATGVEPGETNGEWDAARAAVTWKGPWWPEGSAALPMACKAAWARADSARQRATFGRVLLTGEALAGYCRWYAALPARRQGEWDRMLGAVRPGDVAPIERFAFSDEKSRPSAGADSTYTSAADPARKLILEAAKGGK